jgi:hypothetical protein
MYRTLLYRTLFSLLAVCLFVSAGMAEDTISFQKAVDRYEENMAKLLSYVAKVTVYEQTSERSTVSPEVIDVASVSEFEMIADVTRDSVLIVGNRYVVGSSHLIAPSSSKLYLRCEGKSYRCGGDGLFPIDNPIVPYEGVFDPRIVGTGFCFEIRSYIPFQNVIANLRQWSDDPGVSTDGGENLKFGRAGEFVVCSKKSQFAIVEAVQSGVKFKTVYEEREGVVLPKSSIYHCTQGRQLLIECDWIVVNEPIPEYRFQPEEVARLAGLKYSP